MEKVIIIGCPGAGKSRLARQLGELCQLPVVHLDHLNWNADKTTVSPTTFLNRQRASLSKDKWIVDGNYGTSLDMRFQACDTVIFLDFPVELCLAGVRERLGKERPDMPWVETELEEEFLQFIHDFSKTNRPQIVALLEKYKHKKQIRLCNRAEVERWIEQITLESSWK